MIAKMECFGVLSAALFEWDEGSFGLVFAGNGEWVWGSGGEGAGVGEVLWGVRIIGMPCRIGVVRSGEGVVNSRVVEARLTSSAIDTKGNIQRPRI
jgi:hypothetical protein